MRNLCITSIKLARTYTAIKADSVHFKVKSFQFQPLLPVSAIHHLFFDSIGRSYDAEARKCLSNLHFLKNENLNYRFIHSTTSYLQPAVKFVQRNQTIALYYPAELMPQPCEAKQSRACLFQAGRGLHRFRLNAPRFRFG